jgi:hypothetical protein
MSTILKHARASRLLSWGLAASLAALLAACGQRSVVGRQIQFGEGGDSERYRTLGWSHTEETFTWTEGNSAKLSLPIADESGPLKLKMSMAAFTHLPDWPSQPVEVFVNGQKLAEWQVNSNPAEYQLTIPADKGKGGRALEIEFRTPKATSPKSVGLNEDPRVLGVCLQWLELTKSG